VCVFARHMWALQFTLLGIAANHSFFVFAIFYGVRSSALIFRLGRTGRAGKEGQGILVLTDVESGFLQHLEGLDISVHTEMQALIDGGAVPENQARLAPLWETVGRDRESDLAVKASKAYVSVLGFYNTNLKARCGVKGTNSLVKFANTFAHQVGFAELPELEAKTVGKMGLRDAVGLNVAGKSRPRIVGSSNGVGQVVGGNRTAHGGRNGGARNLSTIAAPKPNGGNTNNGLSAATGQHASYNGGGGSSAATRNGNPRNRPRASDGAVIGNVQKKRASPQRDDARPGPQRKRASRGKSSGSNPNATQLP
jgi:hypothetical protein